MRQVALRKAVQLGWSDDPSGRGQSTLGSEVQLRESWLNRIYPGFRGVGGSWAARIVVCGLENEVRSVNNRAATCMSTTLAAKRDVEGDEVIISIISIRWELPQLSERLARSPATSTSFASQLQ